MYDGFVDIHCHLLPGIDDGARDWETTLAMARMAVADGTRTIIVTPHQLGNFSQNRGEAIRQGTQRLQLLLEQHKIPLEVLPGADVRIEDNMIDLLENGDVISLGDCRRHVLLELPHELYMPMEGLLTELSRRGMVGILSHPERNKGILRDPELLPPLVDAGCLMQVTAGSLAGTFGQRSQKLAEWMLRQGLVHFVASDAHGVKSRRPLLKRAFNRVSLLVDQNTATDLCATFPAMVARGESVPAGRRCVEKRGWKKLFTRRKAERCAA